MRLASIEGGDLSKVWEIKTLGLVKDGEARKLLEDVAKQVQPIMRKRKWKVPLLSEFCPNNPSLLGLNIDGGREIRIRLRRSRGDSQLFGYEETLGTMLHELTHIQCGPHDAAFYKLLDVLTKECEELMMKGITGTGQGFDARGHRLGGVTKNPAPRDLRQVALAAAERRSRVNSLMPAGPQRLGGDSDIMNSLSPLQAAAMAAERRLKDDFWCAAPVTAGEDGMVKAREREDSGALQSDPNILQDVAGTKNNVHPAVGSREIGKKIPAGVDIVVRTATLHAASRDSNTAAGRKENSGFKENSQGSESSAMKKTPRDFLQSVAAKRILEATETERFTSTGATRGDGSQSNPIQLDDRKDASREVKENSWECHICTLANSSLALSCGVCATPRRQVPTSMRTWICKFCTLQNEELLRNCAACDQWRYSYGAPSASRAPNVGT